MQFERKAIPEAQKAEQALKRNEVLDEANARLSAQVQVYLEKAKRCERSALQWQDQLDNEKAAHRSVMSAGIICRHRALTGACTSVHLAKVIGFLRRYSSS